MTRDQTQRVQANDMNKWMKWNKLVLSCSKTKWKYGNFHPYELARETERIREKIKLLAIANGSKTVSVFHVSMSIVHMRNRRSNHRWRFAHNPRRACSLIRGQKWNSEIIQCEEREKQTRHVSPSVWYSFEKGGRREGKGKKMPLSARK